jgi:DNA-directed RNA polymerase specialized sigma24 family protein
MDAASIITREVLAPLLHEGWAGPEAAWKALERCSSVIMRVVAARYHKYGRYCRVLEDQGDLLTYTVCDLLEKAERKKGLALPVGWDQPDLTPWLASVVSRQAIDVLRRLGRQERERLTPEGDTDAVGAALLGGEGAAAPTPGARLDVQRAHEAIRSLLERGDVPPVQALAWVLLAQPRLLTREWVDRASGLVHQGRVDTQRGVMREPEETWTLLCDWLPRHALDPRGRDSRRELAWILRSEDNGSPDSWRSGSPDEVRKAMDTLRKWENRFRPLVRAQLGEGTP